VQVRLVVVKDPPVALARRVELEEAVAVVVQRVQL
jgi:hypothetical protein